MKNPYKCEDCNIDTRKNLKDYYMVTCAVWNLYGLGGSMDCKGGGWKNITGKDSGMLCMNCLEDRIGRKLKKKDLMWCGVYLDWNPYTRKILLK